MKRAAPLIVEAFLAGDPRRRAQGEENVMKKLCGLAVFAVVLLAVLGAAPASAAGGCGQALTLPDLGKALTAKGETCPAVASPKAQTLPAPDFLISTGGKTCKCSCGYPCTTDADCGGAVGSCRAGITCC
jgi:hypothetical protein